MGEAITTNDALKFRKIIDFKAHKLSWTANEEIDWMMILQRSVRKCTVLKVFITLFLIF